MLRFIAMSKFIQRQIAPIIKAQKSKFPVLALTGPRQSGKTTLLKELFGDYRYVSLENPNIRSFAMDDPIGFLNHYDQKVILDEVQRVPGRFVMLLNRSDRGFKLLS